MAHSGCAWACRGAAAYTSGDYVEEATRYFKKAIALDPANVGGHTGLIDCLLARQETRAQAFAQLQKMHESPAVQRTLHLPGEGCDGFDRDAMLKRLWKGESVPDKSIFLWLGGAAGDHFLQVRYAPLLRERCQRVIVSAGFDDAALLATCPGVDTVLQEYEWAEDPAMVGSLWTTGRMILAHFYAQTPPPPYLFARSEHVEKWRKRLVGGNLKVGLCWQGGQVTSFGSLRDCPLNAFARLGQVPGVDFYSLQKGEGMDDPTPDGLKLQRLGDHLYDWEDTAGVLENMDVFLSTDCGPLHLSAALDRPTWGLITTQFWSWVYQEGEFYPSLRVFRKKISEPWEPLMEEVAAALRVLAERHHNSLLAYEIA